MTGQTTFVTLKEKQRAIRAGFPQTMGLRVHRAISWIGRAEACGEDHDARFIFLWIAFNAAYADEREFLSAPVPERDAFRDFFGRLTALDAERRIYKAVWQRFSGPVRLLLENRYVFNPFWQHHNGIAGCEDWEDRFRLSARTFARAFQDGDSVRVLSLVFDRLYVLRNQLVHGGATWNSAVNRAQVRDGAAILGFLMPIFVDLMMDHPQEDWGQPFYPVVS
ncbi:HEPN domain-containing protein [Thetidibacter halocola]|uniref:Apea-like HEPN domain-containing protein n=1 Tax=Thetidibacter halocola TaxID=2827239 RepID=A0A8J7WFM6_9RHOB|nr:HEPN domain-containing protein [Thetidibacter halocola]MBS0124496.1 hypothetical protein [Thetidibacter halocola]